MEAVKVLKELHRSQQTVVSCIVKIFDETFDSHTFISLFFPLKWIAKQQGITERATSINLFETLDIFHLDVE